MTIQAVFFKEGSNHLLEAGIPSICFDVDVSASVAVSWADNLLNVGMIGGAQTDKRDRPDFALLILHKDFFVLKPDKLGFSCAAICV